MLSKRRKISLSVIGIILLIPLISMQFTNEVNWNAADFIVAGLLLFGADWAIKSVMVKVFNPQVRNTLIAVIIIAVILIWAELAVGLFGTPFAGN